MKILLLASGADAVGGCSRNVSNITSALELSGHNVTLLGLKKDYWSFIKQAYAEAKLADFVFAIDINPVGFIGYILTRFVRAKFVIIAQAAYAVAPLHSRKTALFAQLVYRSANGIISGSTFVSQEIQKKIPGIRIAVIDPGIDMSKFFDTNNRLTQPSDSAPYILGVGAVKSRKGYEFTLRALARVHAQMPLLRYKIVGSQKHEPGYVKRLKNLVQEFSLQKNVDFLDEVSDVDLKHLYEHASMFVLTSINEGLHFEGFGMVFLEAAAYGLPTIGTFGNGIVDAVENGKTGILVPQRDEEATARAIIKIIGDIELAKCMRARALEFVREHDLVHVSQAYDRFFEDLLHRGTYRVFIYQIERDLLGKQIAKFAHYLHGDILDIGGGEMNRYQQLFISNNYTRLDIRPYPGLDIVASADNIPLPDESTDSIISTQVLEHVRFPEKCVQEMFRVLKKNGHALITVPQWNELHDEPVDFWRYTKYGLIDLFERNGFTVVEYDQRGGYFSNAGQMALRYCIDRFHLHQHPVFGRIVSRLFQTLSVLVQFLDRIDKSVANRKHTIGWCFVFIKK